MAGEVQQKYSRKENLNEKKKIHARQVTLKKYACTCPKKLI